MSGQDLNLELVIKARGDQARAEIAATNASVKSVQAEAAAATQASAAQMSAALKQVGGDLRKVTPEMLGLGTAASAASTEVVAGTEAAAASMNGLRLTTSGMIQEYVRMARAVATGQFERLPSELATAASRAGGLQTAFGGVSLAALGTAAAVAVVAAGLGYLIYKSLEEEKHLDDLAQAFKTTGRAAEFSRDWISYEKDSLSSLPNVTSKAVDSYLTFVAEHAQISAQLADQVGQLMGAWRLEGDKAGETAGQLALKLSDLTVNGFRKLNDETLNLPPAEAEAIAKLIETGDTAKAVQQILADLSKQAGIYAKSLGDHVHDTEQKIAQLKAELADASLSASPLVYGGSSAVLARLYQQIDEAQKHLAALRRQETSAPKVAADKAYGDEVSALDAINAKTDERVRLTQQLANVEKTLSDARTRNDTGAEAKATEAIAATKAKLAELDKRHAEQSYSVFEQTENAKAQAFKAGSAERIAILVAEAARAKALFGTESTQYQEAMGRLVAARREAADQETRLAKEAAQKAKENLDREVQEANQAARKKLEDGRTLAQQRVQLGQITASQEIAQERELQENLYRMELGGLNERLQKEKLTVAEKKRINDQIEALEQQHQLKMEELNNKATLDIQKQWEKALEPVGQAFDQSVKGMIQGTQSFRQALGSILDSVVAEYVDMGVKALLHHVAMEAAKTTATAAAATERTAIETTAKAQSLVMSAEVALKEILNDAWQAAAAAFKATAAIPVIGPVLAPAAGVAAFTAVAAMGGNIASAAGGYWELPSDQMIFAHEREMVLPARFADGLRDVIEGGRAAAQGSSHTTINAVDADSLTRLLKRNPRALAAGLKSVRRNGSFR